jgi:hypothetical protein
MLPDSTSAWKHASAETCRSCIFFKGNCCHTRSHLTALPEQGSVVVSILHLPQDDVSLPHRFASAIHSYTRLARHKPRAYRLICPMLLTSDFPPAAILAFLGTNYMQRELRNSYRHVSNMWASWRDHMYGVSDAHVKCCELRIKHQQASELGSVHCAHACLDSLGVTPSQNVTIQRSKEQC